MQRTPGSSPDGIHTGQPHSPPPGASCVGCLTNLRERRRLHALEILLGLLRRSLLRRDEHRRHGRLRRDQRGGGFGRHGCSSEKARSPGNPRCAAMCRRRAEGTGSRRRETPLPPECGQGEAEEDAGWCDSLPSFVVWCARPARRAAARCLSAVSWRRHPSSAAEATWGTLRGPCSSPYCREKGVI